MLLRMKAFWKFDDDNNENEEDSFNNFHDMNINNNTRYNSRPLILETFVPKHMPSKNSKSKQKRKNKKEKQTKCLQSFSRIFSNYDSLVQDYSFRFNFFGRH